MVGHKTIVTPKNDMDSKYKITQEEFEKEYKKLKEQHLTVKDWEDFSLMPQSPRDIIIRSIARIFDEENDPFGFQDTNYICWTYVCARSKFDEELIDVLIYITSGLFCIECWDLKVIDYVVGLVNQGRFRNCYEDIKSVAEGKVDLPKRYVEFCKDMIEHYKDNVEFKINRAKRIIQEHTDDIDRYKRLIEESNKKIKEIMKTTSEDKLNRINEYYTQINNKRDLTKRARKGIEVQLKHIDRFEYDLVNPIITADERLDFIALYENNRLTTDYLVRRAHLFRECY